MPMVGELNGRIPIGEAARLIRNELKSDVTQEAIADYLRNACRNDLISYTPKKYGTRVVKFVAYDEAKDYWMTHHKPQKRHSR